MENEQWKILWRLSIVPFAMVLLVVLLVVVPIKWVFTGDHRFEKGQIHWLRTWIEKIGLK